MAQQNVSNERKKELEQIDAFQAGLIKALEFGKTYQKQLLVAAGAVVLVMVIFSAVMYSFQRSETKAAELASQALTAYGKAGDPQKGYTEVEDDFSKLFSEYANTAAGRLGLIQFAKICYDASKFDKSYQFYKEALDVFRKDALMKNFLLSSLGNVSLAKNDVEGAKKYFMQIKKGDLDLLKDEAQFHLALLLEGSDDAQSRQMYESILAQHEQSMYASIAKSKMEENK